MRYFHPNIERRFLVTIISLFALAHVGAFGEDIVVVIDPNAGGATGRSDTTVITSICTVFSLPDLKRVDHMILGEKVAATVVGNKILMITGQPVGATGLPDSPFNNQIHAVFSLNPLHRVTQFSLPGFLSSFDAIFPEPITYLRSSKDNAYALMFSTDGLSEKIVGLDASGKIITNYPIPKDETQLVSFYPFLHDDILLNVFVRDGGMGSTLKLLDIKTNEIKDVHLTPGYVRLILPNLQSSDSFVATEDGPAFAAPALVIITHTGNKFTLDRRKMPFDIDWKNKCIMQGIRISETKLLLATGWNGEINDLYIVDLEKGSAKKVISFNVPPASFAVTSDAKYLVTVGAKNPQVAVYDLLTFKLLNKEDKVGHNPIIAVCN
jgi:hypothetical protein